MKAAAVTVLVLVSASWYAGAQEPLQPKLASGSLDGRTLYTAHCEVCHGREATGNGPMAAALKTKVPDLSRLARRNNGVFPLQRVQMVIDGTAASTLSHGTREMPVWGPVFSEDLAERDFSKLRIFNLAHYLEKLQK